MRQINSIPRAYGVFGLVRGWLFRADAETSHLQVLHRLAKALKFTPVRGLLSLWLARRSNRIASQHFGLHFHSPVGLAAGFDKDGELVHGLHALGFGFAEVGTVTPRPQSGNPRPRLWRLLSEGALLNSMGFNNQGGEALAKKLERLKKRPIPIGVNLGKNRDTDNANALQDYLQVLEQTYRFADYFVINVSSPNTQGLRDLQQPDALAPLLAALSEHGKRLAILHGVVFKPMLVKLSPELNDAELAAILKIVVEVGLQGVLASNTVKTEKGGKSGYSLFSQSRAMVEKIRRQLGPEYLIIGVGGIFSAADAIAMLESGANLVQIYTGWIYRGPLLVPKINAGLNRLLRRHQAVRLNDYLRNLWSMKFTDHMTI